MPSPRTRLISAALALLAALLVPTQRHAHAQGSDPFLSLLAHEVDPKTCAIGTLVPDMPLLGFDAKGPTLSEALKDRKAMVLCLTSATCPLSSRYGPRLAGIATEYLPKGVGFALVNVSDTDTEPEMRQQNKDLRWAGLYVPDAERVVRRAITPRTTSEVLVIDAGRTLAYRGAVDDQFGVGSALAEAKRTFLRDAIEAVLAGRPVPVSATWSPGCAVDPPEKGETAGMSVTYHNRVSRIVRERCESCHFNGGPSPFSLETYRAVSGRSSMIAAVVRAGLMPPWDARPATGEGEKTLAWKHDPTLTEDERRDLLAWLDGARPEGDPKDAPSPVTRNAGWQMGAPDGVLLSPRVDVPADGGLVYARLEIDTMLREPAWVSSWELMARKRMALHHAVMFLERERLPEGMSDDTALREGRLEPILAAGAAHSAAACPPDSARAVPAGARLIVHAWLRPTGKVMGERLRVAFRVMRDAPTNIVRSIPAWTDAPAPGGAAWTAQSTMTEAATLVAVTPTISLAAKDVTLTQRAGKDAEDEAEHEARTLFSAGRFRAAWPTRYEPLEPPSLAPASVLTWNATPTEEPAAGGAHQGLAGFLGFVEVMLKRE
jgi:hypothetical protein